ncbi:NAD(P)/FAD-dependent oxidoreductase [Bizionia sediminis]|uniref:NAD(P)/FAD-dependent oxidoreductase n=1 Tax=Bizionia sediminis TaxID=1737064 RepID=A0ABW5KU29_9FLAO
MKQEQIVIIGGGAAGFFAAINVALLNPHYQVTILEKGKTGLQKVKISGGGRCNITHANFEPVSLTENYPRGEKELLGPFHQFMTGDTMAWFEERGVALKIEEDGRIFPVSNSSQTIIDCFLKEAEALKINVQYSQNVTNIEALNDCKGFEVTTKNATYTANKLLIATGSSVKFWKLLENLGHTVIQPVPSLFTFNIQDDRIADIPGVVVQNVHAVVANANLHTEGPLLITHVGLSGPAILKLSAFGALELAASAYNFDLEINFVKQSYEECLNNLKELKQQLAKKTVVKMAQMEVPKRLWRKLVLAANILETDKWADLNKGQLEKLASQLTKSVFQVTGKSTFKDEFVTAGGVDLKEVNFRRFESRLFKNLFFAGEVLNIDAITGGYNFQNAWTGAYIAAKSM